MLVLPASPLAGGKTGKGNWMGLGVLGTELFKINKPELTAPTRLRSEAPPEGGGYSHCQSGWEMTGPREGGGGRGGDPSLS